jgi:molybdate transport system substrate-binding protein
MVSGLFSIITLTRKKALIILPIVGLSALAAYLLSLLIYTSPQSPPRKEMLIYCGITMIKPLSEIAAVIEKREDIKISIIKGGSGNLLKSFKFNRQGDLYLPGSESYIRQAMAEGFISKTVHVGYNKAAMMVREGNPKGIQHSLDALKDPSLYIVIGNPDSGSIGKETKKILTSAGIFKDAMSNAKELTTDSKRLIEVLKNGEADLIINWHATATWPENSDLIDPLPIDERYASKKRLVLGLLVTSKHPEIATKFMDYAASEEGRRIFDRYGLYQID